MPEQLVHVGQTVLVVVLISAGSLLIRQSVWEIRRLRPWPLLSSVVLLLAGAGLYVLAFFYLDYLRWGGLVCP
jgi:hypothetical protein